jgi:hypothetical protein
VLVVPPQVWVAQLEQTPTRSLPEQKLSRWVLVMLVASREQRGQDAVFLETS